MDGDMRRLKGDSVPIFSEAIGLILYRWSALRTAVENEWGGRDSRLKADQLAADLLSWFTHSKEPLYIDDLENMLEEAMLSLNVEVEDGSVEEVAENLLVIHEEFLDGNFRSISTLREANLKQAAQPRVTQIVNDDEDSEEENGGNDESVIGYDSSSNMNVDIPKYESNVNPANRQVSGSPPTVATEEDDGWTAVSNRRNKGRKN
ncbi:hypothetical protein TanjilG_01758 [Lupinus angustifolius]|uniref:Pre-rRNA-processing protein TSR2 homolog n=1 Tax=Lupinus angustifolius TaxID=3871 RepID=A0A4P1RS96_LUPAN|nr:PREDICTED: pre-rRNA-processing protein TSR2-like [Lupinus angustifolius]OIW16893.1 hypothetical protein TanjilG_01758 [Lupinus angustifolius]